MNDAENKTWNRASDTITLEDGYYHEWNAKAIWRLVSKQIIDAWKAYHDGGRMMAATEEQQCCHTGAAKAQHYEVTVTIEVREVTE